MTFRGVCSVHLFCEQSWTFGCWSLLRDFWLWGFTLLLFFFFFGDEVSWKKGRRFFNYCQWALQEKSWKRKKSRFHSNRLNRPIFCFLKMVLPQFYIVKECSHCLLPKNPISHRKRQNYPFFCWRLLHLRPWYVQEHKLDTPACDLSSISALWAMLPSR